MPHYDEDDFDMEDEIVEGEFIYPKVEEEKERMKRKQQREETLSKNQLKYPTTGTSNEDGSQVDGRREE